MREEAWEADEDEAWADEDADRVVPCPYCGADVIEDSPRCSECGTYLSDEDRPPERKSPWIVVGIVIGLVIAFAWAAGW